MKCKPLKGVELDKGIYFPLFYLLTFRLEELSAAISETFVKETDPRISFRLERN